MRIGVVAFLACLAFAPSVRGDDASQSSSRRYDARHAARDLLEQWTDAQNHGDFDAYRALYATTFHGVRRSANRVARFDLAGWTKDRAPMFQHEMKVEVSDERVALGPKSVRVVFTQDWRGGSYHDHGRKELVIARIGDTYLIVHEELFSSTRGASRPRAPEAFMYVVEGRLVLSTAVDDEWEAGAPKRVRGAEGALIHVQRPVHKGKLPAAIAAWPGRVVQLFDDKGPRCKATVGALSLVGRNTDEPEPNAADEWSLSTHLLVAELTPDGPCAGASWARLASLPTPAIATATPASPELVKAAMTRLRAHAAYAALQADYRPFAASNKALARRWDRADEQHVMVMALPDGTKLVSATAGGGASSGDSCADASFEGHLWMLWRVDAAGAWTLANRPDLERALVPAVAVDLDGDGVPELLFHAASDYGEANGMAHPEEIDFGVVRTLGGFYDDVEGLSLWSHFCPC